MDCGVPFCQAGMMIGGAASGCPLNNLIPEWNELIYRGKWELALRRLMATNRFPEFTSRVCPALCEAACTCGNVTGNPVTVRENEHAIIETGYAKGWVKASPAPGPHRQERGRHWQRPLRPGRGRVPEQAGPRRYRLRAGGPAPAAC